MATKVNALTASFNLRNQCRLVIAIVFFMLSFHAQSEVRTIKIGVFSDQLPLLEKLTEEQECPAVSLSRIGENQMLLEYLIICNLLKNTKTQTRFDLVGFPVVPRLVAAIAVGEIDVSGFGIWKNESNKAGVLRSLPLLASGEFSKGLYVTAETMETLHNQPKDWFTSLIVVSNRNWTYDWQLLNCEFEQVLHIDRYEQMFRLLTLQRADVLPLAFGKNGAMTRQEFGTTLYPLQGIKLAFPDSTHILIAQGSNDAETLKRRINSGLEKLKKQQKLAHWYNNIGVIKPQVKNWRQLCSRY